MSPSFEVMNGGSMVQNAEPQCHLVRHSVCDVPQKSDDENVDEVAHPPARAIRKRAAKVGDFLQNYLGILLAGLSGIFSTAYSILYKVIKADLDNSTVLMLRGVLQILFMLFAMVYYRSSAGPNKTLTTRSPKSKVLLWFVFIVTSLLGGLRLCLIFASLERIPMAVVHTIFNGTPVLVMIFSYFFLHEPCNVIRILGTFTLIAGIFLVFEPVKFLSEHMEASDILGYAFSTCALFLSAMVSILTKTVNRHFDNVQIVLFLGVAILVIGYAKLMFFPSDVPFCPESPFVWCMAIIVALCGIGQQICLIAALKLDTATKVTIVCSLQIVLSYVMDVVLMTADLNTEHAMGALLVMMAIFMVTCDVKLMKKLNKCRRHSGNTGAATITTTTANNNNDHNVADSYNNDIILIDHCSPDPEQPSQQSEETQSDTRLA